jgi:hypothetical protein
MSVVAIHQTSKPHELAREINRLTDGIERDSKLAGQYLATFKGRKAPRYHLGALPEGLRR